VRLAGQFRALRPGALVGLTIPTVPALRGGEQVLLPVRPATGQTVARFIGRSTPSHPSPSAQARPAPTPAWDPRPC
jgi:hypothetical protein